MFDYLKYQTITNAMLKTIIDVIEVDSDSNVEVRLKLLNEIGSTPAVITNFSDINPTVTKSNVGTQRCIRKTKEDKPSFSFRGKKNIR